MLLNMYKKKYPPLGLSNDGYFAERRIIIVFVCKDYTKYMITTTTLILIIFIGKIFKNFNLTVK